MPPKNSWSHMFCTTDLVSSKQVAHMYEEENYFWKLLLKHSETVFAHLTPVTLTFKPVNPKSMGVPATQDGYIDHV